MAIKTECIAQNKAKTTDYK